MLWTWWCHTAYHCSSGRRPAAAVAASHLRAHLPPALQGNVGPRPVSVEGYSQKHAIAPALSGVRQSTLDFGETSIGERGRSSAHDAREAPYAIVAVSELNG